MQPEPDSIPPRPSSILLLAFTAGILGTFALTFLPSSASIIWDFRWFPAFILTVLLTALGTLALSHRQPLQITAPTLFLLLTLTGLCLGSLTGPFPKQSLLVSFPLFTGLTWCMIAVSTPLTLRLLRTLTSPKALYLLFGLVSLWCFLSLTQFIRQDVLPAWTAWHELNTAAGGGIFHLLRAQGLRDLRNAHPFGHMNYTSGFLLLLLPLLWTPKLPDHRPLRHLRTAATLLGALVLLSLQSRNTLAGLVTGTAALILWNSRNKKTLLLQGGTLLLFLVLFYALSPRFHGRFFQEGSSRWGVWQLAWNTGLAYFPWGTGDGLAPEVSDQLAHTVAAKWPSLLQFHHGWLHLWSAGGIPALLGFTALTLWILLFLLRKPAATASPDTLRITPSLFALFAYFMVMLSDYQFDLLPILFLWGLHLGLLCNTSRISTLPMNPHAARGLILLPAAAALIACLTVLPAATRSRVAMEQAGSAWERGEIARAAEHYETAHAAMGEPYPLNLKAHLLAQNPETRAESIHTFERSLAIWPHQTIPLDMLTALHLHEAGTQHRLQNLEQEQAALQKAASASNALLRISPDLSGVFATHALIRSKQNAPETETVNLLLNEVLHRSHMITPGNLHRVTGLGSLEPAVVEHLLHLPPESDALLLLQGFALHLQGLNPDTAPDAAARFALHRQVHPALKLLDAALSAPPEQKHPALHRFCVYLTRQPLAPEQTLPLLPLLESPHPFQQLLQLTGQSAPAQTLYAAHGLRARHPLAPPLKRMAPSQSPKPGLLYPIAK